MRHAFMLLGIMTLIVSIGAFIAFERAEAPTNEEVVTTDNQPITMALTLTSPAFENGGKIPSKFTCDADNVNPEFRISGVPEGTKSLVLVMDDPDIPDSVKEARGIEKFDHWALFNIPPPPAGETIVIKEASSVGTQGMTSRGGGMYVGPCPPDREHRYFFRLYALSGTLNFVKAPTLDEIEQAAKGMMLESTTLMGRYERQ